MLTDERIDQLWDSVSTSAYWQYREVEAFARAVEAEATAELRAERDALRELYNKLIMAVGTTLYGFAAEEIARLRAELERYGHQD